MAYISTIFNYIIKPFESLHPIWLITAFSFVSSILILIIFRYTSNQQALRRVKNRMKAHLLEIVLYRNSFRVLMSAQKNLMLYNAKYIMHTMRPLLVMIIPMALCLAQVHDWLGYTPLEKGRSTLLKIKLSDNYKPLSSGIYIKPGKGIKVETPALRIAETNEVVWRIKAETPGMHSIAVKAGGDVFTLRLAASGSSLSRITSEYVTAGIWNKILYSAESASLQNLMLNNIEISYPDRSIIIWGINMHWMVAFLILTIIFSFSLKEFLDIEI